MTKLFVLYGQHLVTRENYQMGACVASFYSLVFYDSKIL